MAQAQDNSSPEPSRPPSPTAPPSPSCSHSRSPPPFLEPSGPSPPADPLNNVPNERAIRKRRQSHSNRHAKCARLRKEMPFPYEVRPDIQKKYIQNAVCVHSQASIRASRVARNSYTALKDHSISQEIYTLEDLVRETSEFHFWLLEWDGWLGIFQFNSQAFMIFLKSR